MTARADLARANRRSAVRLLVTVVAMFGFGYALVPLYDVFCEITGLNGKTGQVQAAALDGVADESRLVTVEFIGTVNGTLPWDFEPAAKKLQVHPGKVYETSYFARNRSAEAQVGQAVPSVSPGAAARHFSKTECFCFQQQRFEAGESRDMSLRFVISKDLPRNVNTVTLSYTFFDVNGRT